MPQKSETYLLERRRAAYYMGRIFRFLRTCRGWTFRYGELHRGSRICKLSGTKKDLAGITFRGLKVIVIDHRYNVIPTLVHECLHAIFRTKSEDEVLRLEKLVMRHLQPVQAARLHQLLGTKLIAWSRR